MTNESNSPGLLSEFACLLICVGVIWMFIPGTVSVEEGTLHVTPDYIPLILLVAGAIGMVIISLLNWSKSA